MGMVAPAFSAYFDNLRGTTALLTSTESAESVTEPVFAASFDDLQAAISGTADQSDAEAIEMNEPSDGEVGDIPSETPGSDEAADSGEIGGDTNNGEDSSDSGGEAGDDSNSPADGGEVDSGEATGDGEAGDGNDGKSDNNPSESVDSGDSNEGVSSGEVSDNDNESADEGDRGNDTGEATGSDETGIGGNEAPGDGEPNDGGNENADNGESSDDSSGAAGDNETGNDNAGDNGEVDTPEEFSTPTTDSDVSFTDISSRNSNNSENSSAPQEPAEPEMTTYNNGTKFHKKGDDTDYFGYTWNSISQWWGIEVWKDSDGTRNVKLNVDVKDGKVPKGKVLVGKNQNINLDLNGNNITGTGSYVLGVNTGANVTVVDKSKGNTGTIAGKGSTAVINDYGTFNLESGSVYATTGRGISVSANAAATISESAAVKTDDTSTNGRAVNVSSAGSLTTSGDISSKAIGIYTKSGSVEMNSGTIDAGTYGVYATGEKTNVDMNGGEITAGSIGAYVSSKASFKISGGAIDAGQYGVYASINADFEMSGGTIAADTTGVYLYLGSNGIVSGGKISAKNELDQYGNGTMGIGILGNQTVRDGVPVDEFPYGKTTLTVSGGTITSPNIAISGNGSVHEDKGYSNGGTVINIEGGTIMGGGMGIYHPQDGVLNISGGSITGDQTGVEMRSGNLNVSGDAEITGNGSQLVGEPNGSGSTAYGAGIAVSQHTTKQGINININGSTIKGYAGLYEIARQGNTDEELAKVNLKVTGGKFVSMGEDPVISEHKEDFVVGGMYTHRVGEKYLGCLTSEEMQEAGITSTLEKPTGRVHCIQVESENSQFTYHVGYLTGEPSAPIVMKVGDKSDPLVPQYKLSGVPVDDTVVGAAVDGADVIPVITGWTSGNEAVAAVEDGIVTALSASSEPIAIIATLINGETVTFTITVDDSGDPPDPGPDVPDPGPDKPDPDPGPDVPDPGPDTPDPNPGPDTPDPGPDKPDPDPGPDVPDPGPDTPDPDPGPDTPDPEPGKPDPGPDVPDTPDPGPDEPDPGPDTPDPGPSNPDPEPDNPEPDTPKPGPDDPIPPEEDDGPISPEQPPINPNPEEESPEKEDSTNVGDTDTPPFVNPDIDIPSEDIPLTDVPSTGDGTQFWAGLSLASAIALVALKKSKGKIK